MKISRKMRKMLLMVAAMALVLGLAIGGTVAWLIDSSESVVNTFEPSNVDIELVETKPADKTAKMVPGNEIEKNPKVTVAAGSENCWLFMSVEKSANNDTFLTWTVDSAWTLYKTVDNNVSYYYKANVAAGSEHPILAGNMVTVKDSVTNDQMTALTGATYPKLTFKAAAVQYANITTVEDAWKALPIAFTAGN